MKKIHTSILLTSLIISGCATNYADKSAAEVANAITIKDSEFDEKITYIGPQIFSETPRGLFVDNQTTQLVAAKNKKTGAVNYAVYTRVLYSFDWRFYNSVSFSDGSQIDVNSLNREVNSCTGTGCIHTEELAFPIDRNVLESSGDFKYRLNSKRGTENIIKVKKSYIEGFLLSLKEKAGI